MGSLQYVLEEGNRNGWFESTTIVVLACIAAVAIVAFISHELEIKHPVVDLRVFNNRGYAAATALSFLIGTALFAGSVMLSLYCGTIMHYRALDIGKLFLFATWIQLLIFPIVGRLIGRIDPRWLLLIANLGIFMSLWLNAHLTPAVDMHGLVVPLFVRAIGTGFGFVSITVLGVSALSPAQRPGGTALFNLTRELGASIGIAWMSTLLDSDAKRAFVGMTSHVDAMSPAFAEQRALFVRSVGTWLRDPDAAAVAVVGQRLQGQSLLYAFNHGFLLLAFAFLLGTLLIPLMRRPPRPPAAPARPRPS
jgi:DHA2 family multidrug resistance protein